MRNLILASVAGIFALSGTVYAADVPSYPVEAAMAEPANDWSGFYVGLHGGANWADTEEDDVDIDFGELEGFVAGVQAGYNWQWDNVVFGLEADGSYVDSEDDDGLADDIGQNYLASFRGRLGFGFDRFLVYGTGGAAFTGVDLDLIVGDEDDSNFAGWVAGGGVEFMITENVSLGVEYLHYEFGDENIDDGAILGDEFDLGLSNDVVRGRLNIKFDSLFN
jgi:outer membrane immunogenic protein